MRHHEKPFKETGKRPGAIHPHRFRKNSLRNQPIPTPPRSSEGGAIKLFFLSWNERTQKGAMWKSTKVTIERQRQQYVRGKQITGPSGHGISTRTMGPGGSGILEERSKVEEGRTNDGKEAVSHWSCSTPKKSRLEARLLDRLRCRNSKRQLTVSAGTVTQGGHKNKGSDDLKQSRKKKKGGGGGRENPSSVLETKYTT